MKAGIFLYAYLLTSCWSGPHAPVKPEQISKSVKQNMENLSEADWKKRLSPEEYEVLRQKGTERAFTGKYWNHHEKGTYCCVACGAMLFTSDTKFDSGCGWPSFFKPADLKTVILKPDYSHGMIRTEVQCANCKSHLGHVFDDGPKPTGQRYCINSICLRFEENQPAKK